MTEEGGVITLIVSQLDRIHGDLRDLKIAREEDKKDASESRRAMHATQNEHSQSLSELSAEMKAVKETIAAEKPTWDEYRRMREQALGAGRLGSFLWRSGGWILAAASTLVLYLISVRESIAAWWHWLITR